MGRCPDCGVPVGALHQHGCDVERCPDCGHQAIGCDCVSDYYEFARTPWTGHWPEAATPGSAGAIDGSAMRQKRQRRVRVDETDPNGLPGHEGLCVEDMQLLVEVGHFRGMPDPWPERKERRRKRRPKRRARRPGPY